MNTRIKYIRDTKNNPIACVAWYVEDGLAKFGISIANPEVYTGTVQKKKMEYNPETKELKFLEMEFVQRKGMRDFFSKKEARKLAQKRCSENPNIVTVKDQINPMIDILTLIESAHELLLDGPDNTIISSRIRSGARRAKKAIITHLTEKAEKKTEPKLKQKQTRQSEMISHLNYLWRKIKGAWNKKMGNY